MITKFDSLRYLVFCSVVVKTSNLIRIKTKDFERAVLRQL